MWDLIVSVPDHCLSFYFENISRFFICSFVILWTVTVFQSCVDASKMCEKTQTTYISAAMALGNRRISLSSRLGGRASDYFSSNFLNLYAGFTSKVGSMSDCRSRGPEFKPQHKPGHKTFVEIDQWSWNNLFSHSLFWWFKKGSWAKKKKKSFSGNPTNHTFLGPTLNFFWDIREFFFHFS